MMQAKTAKMNESFVKLAIPRSITPGKDGRRNFLTTKTPNKAGAANIRPVRTLTKPLRLYGIKPKAADIPTRKRE